MYKNVMDNFYEIQRYEQESGYNKDEFKTTDIQGMKQIQTVLTKFDIENKAGT